MCEGFDNEKPDPVDNSAVEDGGCVREKRGPAQEEQ